MVRPPAPGTDVNRHVVATNHDKFDNQNAVTGRLVRRFQTTCRDRLALLTVPDARILDVGAGEGTMTAYLDEVLSRRRIEALEYEEEGCAAFRARHPSIPLRQGSVYELPWPDDEFDVVTSFEVLEHLEHPSRALKEMHRVSSGYVFITVPYEPFFRVGNIARGRYVKRLGNTPGHLNHWSRTSLRNLLRRHFPVAEVAPVFPWLMGTANVRG